MVKIRVGLGMRRAGVWGWDFGFSCLRALRVYWICLVIFRFASRVRGRDRELGIFPI